MRNRILTGFGIAISVILIFTSVLLIYRYINSTYRYYRSQVERLFADVESSDKELISQKDLIDLPAPVRKYLEYVGVTGTEKVRNFSVVIDGEFKMSQDRAWAPVLVEQISFTDNPVRLFYMELKFLGLKIFGLHHYESAAASMDIKILDVFKVAQARGIEMNRSETVTIFNDMCILAPAALIDSRISWREIDDFTVEGTYTNAGIAVKGVLFFNEKGQLINFVSNDRYFLNEDGTYELLSWSTPVGEYREINGLNLPGYGEALWERNDGQFCYAKFNIRDVTINSGLE
ncbi:MAG: hypothetical protein PQJ61_09230 [Spirochaetales bacterium]|uniref:Uncharacterized protein n=1 Tax=Candidatus Thalassospirochaeta sargassi TaxID=3119039 RepID=A0AAJ1IFD9_9SPIO|nr:hypothetical protein [Spirochaetales bacterium]